MITKNCKVKQIISKTLVTALTMSTIMSTQVCSPPSVFAEEDNLSNTVMNFLDKANDTNEKDLENIRKSSRKINKNETQPVNHNADSNVIYDSHDSESKINDSKVFKDMHNHWATSSVTIAITDGWVNGYPDKTFKPSNKVTLGELATMIAKALPLPEDLKHNDVKLNLGKHWAADNLDRISFNLSDSFMEDKNITLDKPLTRRLVATVLIQHLATLLPVMSDMVDHSKYKTAESLNNIPLDIAVESKIFNGTRKGLEWDREVTRAEAVQAIIAGKIFMLSVFEKGNNERVIYGITQDHQTHMTSENKIYVTKPVDIKYKYPSVNDRLNGKNIDEFVNNIRKGSLEAELFLVNSKMVNSMNDKLKDEYLSVIDTGRLHKLEDFEVDKLIKILKTLNPQIVSDAIRDTNFAIMQGFGKRESMGFEQDYKEWIKDMIRGNKVFWNKTRNEVN